MGIITYTIHCTLYSVYSVQCILYTVYIVQCTVYSGYCTCIAELTRRERKAEIRFQRRF